MKLPAPSILQLVAPLVLALAGGCAAPRQLYPGPALPREQVALLRGMPEVRIREGTGGKGNSVAGRGVVVPIGLDGEIFNRRVHAAYSGDAFLLLPGRHALLAYCEYTAHGDGPAKVFYSDLFTLEFTAKAGAEYRYQASFSAGGGRWFDPGVVAATPGVWDVTGTRSVGAGNRVGGDRNAIPLGHRTLTHIQAQVAAP